MREGAPTVDERAHVAQVVDCGSVIAHVFQGQEVRMQYNLEKLWADPTAEESKRQADSSYAL